MYVCMPQNARTWFNETYTSVWSAFLMTWHCLHNTYLPQHCHDYGMQHFPFLSHSDYAKYGEKLNRNVFFSRVDPSRDVDIEVRVIHNVRVESKHAIIISRSTACFWKALCSRVCVLPPRSQVNYTYADILSPLHAQTFCPHACSDILSPHARKHRHVTTYALGKPEGQS